MNQFLSPVDKFKNRHTVFVALTSKLESEQKEAE